MAYLGNLPTTGAFQKLDSISTVNSQTVEKTRTKLERDTDGSYKNFPAKP